MLNFTKLSICINYLSSYKRLSINLRLLLTLFIQLYYQTCNCNMSKTNQPLLIQISTNVPWGKGTKRFWDQELESHGHKKVKSDLEAWRRIILDPLGYARKFQGLCQKTKGYVFLEHSVAQRTAWPKSSPVSVYGCFTQPVTVTLNIPCICLPQHPFCVIVNRTLDWTWPYTTSYTWASLVILFMQLLIC